MVREWWRRMRMKRAIGFNARVHARLQARNAEAIGLVNTFGDEYVPLLKLSKAQAMLMNDWPKVQEADELLFHADNPHAYRARR